MRGDGLEVCQGRFGLGIRKHFFSESGDAEVQLLREVVGSLFLEVFRSCEDVALRDVVDGHGGGGLAFGLDDIRGLFHP